METNKESKVSYNRHSILFAGNSEHDPVVLFPAVGCIENMYIKETCTWDKIQRCILILTKHKRVYVSLF